MATTTANPPAAPAAGDELDDLFDYNVTLDDVFRDVDTNMHAPTAPKPTAIPSRTKNNSHKIDSLGIDEEVKVQRKRAPIAKLDEERLLSQAGIPKLRRITKERLRFKGKGHEYSDVARLLQHYQLWLDELYPRAKFADGLVMVEKLGHKKRLQTMRREWIDEGKPRRTTVEEADVVLDEDPSMDKQDHEGPDSMTSGTVNDERPRTPSPAQDADDDLYSATPQAVQDQRRREREADAGKSLFISDDEGDGEPDGDELDALLAEDGFQQDGGMSSSIAPKAPSHADGRRDDDFNDDLEAMAGMDDMW